MLPIYSIITIICIEFVQNRQYNACSQSFYFVICETMLCIYCGFILEFMQAIGLAIREGRERAELTQEELAELSQVSVRTVRKLESGQSNIGIKALGQIAQVLGLVLTLKPTT